MLAPPVVKTASSSSSNVAFTTPISWLALLPTLPNKPHTARLYFQTQRFFFESRRPLQHRPPQGNAPTGSKASHLFWFDQRAFFKTPWIMPFQFVRSKPWIGINGTLLLFWLSERTSSACDLWQSLSLFIRPDSRRQSGQMFYESVVVFSWPTLSLTAWLMFIITAVQILWIFTLDKVLWIAPVAFSAFSSSTKRLWKKKNKPSVLSWRLNSLT